MTKPRVLIAHPYVYPSGGGNSVAAWAIEALREQYDVTLGALGPLDCEAVNRSFGTSLRPGDFTVRTAPAHWGALIRRSPTPGALLEQCLTMRWAQNLDRENPFAAMMSTQNEADLGRPGIQYVHYPWFYLPRPDAELRWFHRIPGLLSAYRRTCMKLSRSSKEGLRRNLSLANSEFVAAKIREVHGVEAKILYPPVPGGFPAIPWEERIDGFVALGRMHSVKRWDMAVAIMEMVRGRGIELSLTLISHRDSPEFAARLETLAETRPWFRILYDLPRAQMVREIARHRYGLHTMEYEHFGIAPAELQRAGCIAFVHRSGGPIEIVGRREELMFADTDEACARICRVLKDPALTNDLRRHTEERGRMFSEQRFCSEVRGLVSALIRM